MAHRTTILLDDESRRAAKELAIALDVTPSEAVRRAVVAYRDQVVGITQDARKRRVRALARLIELSEGNDADAEIAAIKEQDKHF